MVAMKAAAVNFMVDEWCTIRLDSVELWDLLQRRAEASLGARSLWNGSTSVAQGYGVST